ncbi:MAG: ATP-dependent RNA helicase, partial [Treponema sp.]|nr:ATP-dependent RNA helicase [Treponema sp.]
PFEKSTHTEKDTFDTKTNSKNARKNATSQKDNSHKNEKKKNTKQGDEELTIGNAVFSITKIKGKKTVLLPFNDFTNAIANLDEKQFFQGKNSTVGNLRAKIIFENGWSLLDGEKLSIVVHIAKNILLTPVKQSSEERKLNITLTDEESSSLLANAISSVLRVTEAKQKTKEYGFICIFTDAKGTYWFKVSRGFATALNESLSSLEILTDDANATFTDEQKEKINALYRTLHELYRA